MSSSDLGWSRKGSRVEKSRVETDEKELRIRDTNKVEMWGREKDIQGQYGPRPISRHSPWTGDRMLVQRFQYLDRRSMEGFDV